MNLLRAVEIIGECVATMYASPARWLALLIGDLRKAKRSGSSGRGGERAQADGPVDELTNHGLVELQRRCLEVVFQQFGDCCVHQQGAGALKHLEAAPGGRTNVFAYGADDDDYSGAGNG
ncbi:hypothetical protein B0H11DRAFT_2222307 [Mycena galericulata]|nr:hypothetical protein B0H11DRAFT_2222307 [Mycena galericulata]